MKITKKVKEAFEGVDPIDVILYLNAKYTLLPEISEVFGKEHILKFIETFGGKTIKVPAIEDVEKTVEWITIWSLVRKNNSSENVKKIANRYGIKEAEVRLAYEKVQEVMDVKTKITKEEDKIHKQVAGATRKAAHHTSHVARAKGKGSSRESGPKDTTLDDLYLG